MLLYYMEGRGGVQVVLPGGILVEYVQKCDIVNQLGRKTLPTLYRTVPFLDFWVLKLY